MTNYSKGYGFEREIILQLRKKESILLADRFHKSTGPFWKLDFDIVQKKGKGEHYATKHAPIDIWFLEKNGRMNFAQGKKNNKIQTDEMLDLVWFAMEMNNSSNVFLITKIKKKVHFWKLGHDTMASSN